MKRADTNTLPSSSDLQRELDEQRALVERLQAQLAEKALGVNLIVDSAPFDSCIKEPGLS